jgi:hypothetical protein
MDSAERVLTAAYRMNPRATSAYYLSGYIKWKRGNQDHAVRLLKEAHGSVGATRPVRGVLGEGDTQTVLMAASRTRARERRLFAECVDQLREDAPSLDPNHLYPCVDHALAALR